VSERPEALGPSSRRWSYPMTSATAGCPGSGVLSVLAARLTSGVLAATAATDWWK
jgi:hypothetical protein